jgi:hypothetical protein
MSHDPDDPVDPARHEARLAEASRHFARTASEPDPAALERLLAHARAVPKARKRSSPLRMLGVAAVFAAAAGAFWVTAPHPEEPPAAASLDGLPAFSEALEPPVAAEPLELALDDSLAPDLSAALDDGLVADDPEDLDDEGLEALGAAYEAVLQDS